jgi:hypothetical protein
MNSKEFSKLNVQYDNLLLDRYLKQFKENEDSQEDEDNYFSPENEEARDEESYYRKYGFDR